MSIATLDETILTQSLDTLAHCDADLARIIQRLGSPPLWPRQPGFPTLVQNILEQQVSLASAQAAFERLCASADPLTPQRFLELTSAELKQIGFSRQKTAYCRGLAKAILAGSLDLESLNRLEDAPARENRFFETTKVPHKTSPKQVERIQDAQLATPSPIFRRQSGPSTRVMLKQWQKQQ